LGNAVKPQSRAAQIERPRRRHFHLGYAVAPAGLDQQDRDVRILGQPPRHDSTRRAGSTDDKVIGGPQGAAKSKLIFFHLAGEFIVETLVS
jgi:hypothetical protein